MQKNYSPASKQQTNRAGKVSRKSPKVQEAPARKNTGVSVRTAPRSISSAVHDRKNSKTVTAKRASPTSIPKGNATKGLRFPAKEHDPKQIQSRLKTKSPWYQSLLDPLHGADVKIPDSTGVETGTLQCVQRVSITVPTLSNSVCGVRTTCLHPNYDGTTRSNYQVTDSTTSTALGVQWDTTNYHFETTEALQDYSDSVRIVSAAMYCQSESSLANNSGLMTGYVEAYPPAFTDAEALTYYQNSYKSAIVPINNNEPCITRFYPVKSNGAAYDMFYNPEFTIGGVSAGGEFLNPRWEMGILIHGAPVGTVFLFTMVVNYEFIPFQNAVNILDASPSPVDAQEIDLVELWSQQMDPVQITSNRIVAKPPSSSNVEEPGEGSGFGMFFEVVKEIAPLAMSLLL